MPFYFIQTLSVIYSTRYEKLFLDIAYSYFLCVDNILMYIYTVTNTWETYEST